MAIISVAATRAGQNAVEKAELANAQGSALVGASSVSEYLDGVSRRAEQFGTASDVIDFITDPESNSAPSFGAAKSSPDVRDILVLNDKATVISGFPEASVGDTYPEVSWFTEALAGKTAVGEVKPDSNSGRFVFTVASPARRPGQAVVGVVSIGVTSEDVLFALSQSPLIPGGQALLVDKGRIVAARDHLYQGRTLKEVGLGSLLSAIKKSPKGTIAKVDLPGRGAQVVAWATTTTGTTAIIVEPRDVFLDSINRLARNARLAMIALAILAVAGAITIARRLSKPVSALTAAAQALEADEAPDAAQLEKLGRSRDDIGLLTRVFMRMAEQVVIREKKLREQVRAMRVEIDHSKRAESVEALTESDFFKDLQTRAGDMRQKMKEDLTGTATTADNSEVSDGATKEEA
jgi:HAMP domain-containing protein